MDKVFIVATKADYTIICVAKNEKQAVKKANQYYNREYGERRDDWEAYDAIDYLNSEAWYEGGELMAIRAWED